MKKIFLSSLLLLVSFCFSQSFSQSAKVIGITSEYIKQDSINFQGDSLYDLVVSIHLVDTTNISKIAIKIGNGYGGSDVHNGEFNWFNDTLSTPSKISYSRKFGIISFRIKGLVPKTLFYQANTFNFQSVSDTPYIRQN